MFQKRVSIIVDGYEDGMKIFEKLEELFSEWEIQQIFWDRREKNFFSKKGEKETLEVLIMNDDLVINLLKFDTDKFKEVEKKIEIMGLSKLGNSLKTKLLLGQKANLKKILKSKKIKAPVFEAIAQRGDKELFVNFPQPSKKIAEKYIEEDIEGRDIYTFVFKNKEKEILALSNIGDKEVNKKALEYFQELGIENFALMHFRVSEIRGIYLLDVKVTLDIFIDSPGEIIMEIMEKYSLENLDFLIQ